MLTTSADASRNPRKDWIQSSLRHPARRWIRGIDTAREFLEQRNSHPHPGQSSPQILPACAVHVKKWRGPVHVFSYKDYRDHARRKIARVPALEFIDRFLLHVLPRHVRRIRNYGFLAPNQRGEKLPLVRKLLGMPEAGGAAEEGEPLPEEQEGEGAEGSAVGRPCPVCQRGVLVVISWPRPSIAQIMQLPLEQLRQSRLPFQ